MAAEAVSKRESAVLPEVKADSVKQQKPENKKESGRKLGQMGDKVEHTGSEVPVHLPSRQKKKSREKPTIPQLREGYDY